MHNTNRTYVADKIDEVKSVRDELREEETVRVGWRKLCCCVDDYKVRLSATI